MKRIILLSGGLDSMTLLKDYGVDYFDEKVFINYKQIYYKREYDVVKQYITTILDIEEMKEEDGFFEGRNLKFLLSVRDYFINDDIEVYFGNNIDDTYPDNNPSYFKIVENVINPSYIKNLKIKLPYSLKTKRDIWELSKKLNIQDFYFCYSNLDIPCGVCHSCIAMIKNDLPLI